MQKNIKSSLFIIFILAFAFRSFLLPLVWHPDVRNHVDWGERFWEYGPANFYTGNVWDYTWPNQPPGTMYLFALTRMLFTAVFAVLWWINISLPQFPSVVVSFAETNLYPALVKLPAVLADMGIAYLIYKFIDDYFNGKKKKRALIGATLYLFNPVIWYNSSVWGQYDSVINFFMLASFYFLLKKKIAISFVFLTLSLYTKISLIIFVPIFLIALLRRNFQIPYLILSAFLATCMLALLTWPFSQGEPFTWLYYLYKDKVLGQQLHVITANAFNLWGVVHGMEEVAHTKLLGPMSYEVWGNILFVLAYVPALILAYKRSDIKIIMIALSIAAFSSFMLLTNMHERYLYPLFGPLTILTIINRHYILYGVISCISLLNLYNLWWVPRNELLIEIFTIDEKIVPRLLSFAMVGCFIVFCHRYLFQDIIVDDKSSDDTNSK